MSDQTTIIQMQQEVIEQYGKTLAAHQQSHQKMMEYIKSIYELLLTDIPGSKELAISHLAKIADKVQEVN